MRLEYITAGKIVNAHGIRGDVKVLSGELDPAFLKGCTTTYINGTAYTMETARLHKGCLLLKLKGVDTMDDALDLKGKTVRFLRRDLSLPQNFFFDEELIGLVAIDADSGKEAGTLREVELYPAHKIYAVRGGDDEYLVPAVPAFVEKVDLDNNKIFIHIWEGLGTHED